MLQTLTSIKAHLPPCVQYIIIPIIGREFRGELSEIKKGLSEIKNLIPITAGGHTKMGRDLKFYTGQNC